jgi:hypothetical protein
VVTAELVVELVAPVVPVVPGPAEVVAPVPVCDALEWPVAAPVVLGLELLLQAIAPNERSAMSRLPVILRADGSMTET